MSTEFESAWNKAYRFLFALMMPRKLLDKNEGKTKGAHLSVGVWSGSRLFHAVPISGKDNKGRDHTVYVPQNEQIRISVFSKAFRIAEPSQAVARVTAATGTQVKFTVTGLSSK